MKTIIVVDDEQAVLQAVTDTLNIEGAVYHGTTVMSASLADSANLLSMVRSSIACSFVSLLGNTSIVAFCRPGEGIVQILGKISNLQ